MVLSYASENASVYGLVLDFADDVDHMLARFEETFGDMFWFVRLLGGQMIQDVDDAPYCENIASKCLLMELTAGSVFFIVGISSWGKTCPEVCTEPFGCRVALLCDSPKLLVL